MALAKYHKPPSPLPEYNGLPSLFLGGTIELGKSIDWQEDFYNRVKNLSINVFNPRRVAYNEADIENQIKWELGAMHLSDVVVLNFLPDTKSPISLLEFGLWANSDKLIVHCPEGFWRRTNVLITAEYYGIELVDDFDTLVTRAIEKLKAVKK